MHCSCAVCDRCTHSALLDLRPKNTSPTNFNLTTYGGSGLILAVSPYTLEPGQLAAGGDVMNFDRNPGDIDFFEFSFQRIPGKTDSRSTSSTASNTCLQAKKAAVSTPASIRASSNSAPACFDGDPHTWKQMRSCE